MANQEQLDVLKQGTAVWNIWRDEHRESIIDLREANLSKTDLRDANLGSLSFDVNHLSEYALLGISPFIAKAMFRRFGINLSEANLQEADLRGTHLLGANLSKARLSNANFCDADLRATDLSEADFREADLTNANFEGADLTGAKLGGAKLSGAHFRWTVLSMTDFNNAWMAHTLFSNVDLSLAKGLDTVGHMGLSEISFDTFYNSKGNIPEAFLRGMGVLDTFITYMRSLVGQPIYYSSCFISYSSRDEPFAKRLYTDLQSKGVRCWFAPEDLKIGAKIRPSIDESIHLHDKLLLVLSQHSVASEWVEQEVETALAKEREENRTVLFPIRLDKAVMEIIGGWPALIRNTRNIGNFTRWKQHDAYQKALDRLLRDLKSES